MSDGSLGMPYDEKGHTVLVTLKSVAICCLRRCLFQPAAPRPAAACCCGPPMPMPGPAAVHNPPSAQGAQPAQWRGRRTASEAIVDEATSGTPGAAPAVVGGRKTTCATTPAPWQSLEGRGAAKKEKTLTPGSGRLLVEKLARVAFAAVALRPEAAHFVARRTARVK